MLVSMKEILDRASAEGYAVAAPNVGNELNARASLRAAEEMNAPIILDVGSGASPDMFFFGRMLRELAAQSCVPVAINLDHGGEMPKIMEAIQAGFTSVMVDRSSLPIEANIAQVKQVVELAHSIGVSVEAELGHVGVAANYDVDRDAALTTVEDACRYIEETGVDCLAVAIGTAHGAYPKGKHPYLDFDRLVAIKKATNNFPLVLHGSSGTLPEDVRKACQLGINKVNVANDLCKATAKALQEADLEGQKAYGVLTVAEDAWKDAVKYFIDIYGSKDKAWTKPVAGLTHKTGTLEE